MAHHKNRLSVLLAIAAGIMLMGAFQLNSYDQIVGRTAAALLDQFTIGSITPEPVYATSAAVRSLVDTWAAAPTIDALAANIHVMTLAGDTALAINNNHDGRNVAIYACQDGTGNHALNIYITNPGLVWRGAWSSVTAYVLNDSIAYNGASWKALTGSTNITPGSDGTKWTQIAAIHWRAGAQAIPTQTAAKCTIFGVLDINGTFVQSNYTDQL